MRKIYIAAALASLLTGCSSLPTSGPTADALLNNSVEDGEIKYELIDVNSNVVDILSKRPPESLASAFGDYRPPADVTIGVGDMVTVTVWEAAAGGLFSAPMLADRFSTGSKSATIPEQSVGRDGSVTIPYGGRVRIAGLKIEDAERAIEKTLEGKAIQPQALVSIIRAVSNSVTVMGEVVNGARVPLSMKGDRLLDVVATAGGVKAPVNDTLVQLTRGEKTSRVTMARIVQDPRENIFMRPDDILTMIHEPQKFVAYGATGRNEEIPFGADGINLAQALAKAGGLIDTRADPQGVFVMRYEKFDIAKELVPESVISGYTQVPMVYRMDLRNADSLLVAQKFMMQPKDVLYVSNAPLSDSYKVLQALGFVTGTAGTIAGIQNSTRN